MNLSSKSQWFPNQSNWYGWSVLLLTILISIGWIMNTYLHTDDFVYQHILTSESWGRNTETISSYSQIPKAIYAHWTEANGRLSNLTYLLFVPLPYWVAKIVIAFCLSGFCISLWKWAGRNSLGNPAISTIIPLLIWCGLQWNDQMQSSDFQFNYTIPSFMMMVILIEFFKKEKIKTGLWILLIVFGLWHESFTISLMSILFIFWCFNKKKDVFIALSILIICLCTQFLSATLARIDYHHSIITNSSLNWTMLVIKSWMSIVAICWWLLRRVQVDYKTRHRLDVFGLGFVLGWFAAIIMFITLNPLQRFHWSNDVLAIAFIILILNSYQKTTWPMGIKISFLTLYFAWGCSLVYWQNKVLRFDLMVKDNLQQKNIVINDFDNLYSYRIPFWLMSMVEYPYSAMKNTNHVLFSKYISSFFTESFIILQNGLIDTEYDEWPEVPGGLGIKQPTPGMLVIKEGQEIPWNLSVTGGSPNISMTPLNLLISAIKGSTETQTITTNYWPAPITINGENYLVIYIDNPLLLRGRDILRIEKP